MKQRIKRLMSAMLSLAVSVNMIPVITLAEHQDQTKGEAVYNAEAAQVSADKSGTEKTVAAGELEWKGEIELSSALTQYQAADNSDVVSLKNGTYANWIDRINVPQYAVDFYNSMAEAADNDGDNDWLINDAKGNIAVTKIEGTAKSEEDALDQIRDRFNNEVAVNVQAVFAAFDRDYPEVFWLSGKNTQTATWEYYEDGTYSATTYFKKSEVWSSEYTSSAQIKSAIVKRNQAVASILSGATGTDAEKMAYFNSWLTANNAYNTDMLDKGECVDSAFECLSALTGRRGTAGPVCEGYARAFKVLCDQSGINCTLVDGYARTAYGSAEEHMWNYAQVDGAWYGVDVTWNDPLVDGHDGDGTDEYLLVGADTVIGGRSFISSHPVSNRPSTLGIAFINGPEISRQAYEKRSDIHVHRYDIETVEPTCTGEGSRAGICTVCGYTYTESIPSTGHSYEATVVHPTCIEEGYTAYVCENCGHEYRDSYEEAMGHYWDKGEVTKQPTAHEPGTRVYTCTHCDETMTEEIPPLEPEPAAKISLKDCVVTMAHDQHVYTGKEHPAKVIVMHGDTVLKKGRDYTVAYENNLNPGTAKVILTGIGEYTDHIKTKFEIVPAKVKNLKATNTANSVDLKWDAAAGAKEYEIYRWKGHEWKLVATVSKTKWSDTSAAKHEGNYAYRVCGKCDSHVGKTVKVSTYHLRQIKINSLKNTGASKMTVSWKHTAHSTGYEIYYSTSKDFKTRKVIKIPEDHHMERVISKLTKGKTYYVKVRSYRTKADKSHTWYSAWSDVKSVKITK